MAAAEPSTRAFGDKYDRLIAKKAERLKDLLKCKRGNKRYKHVLKDYLDVDADLEKLLRKRVNAIISERTEAPAASDSPS